MRAIRKRRLIAYLVIRILLVFKCAVKVCEEYFPGDINEKREILGGGVRR